MVHLYSFFKYVGCLKTFQLFETLNPKDIYLSINFFCLFFGFLMDEGHHVLDLKSKQMVFNKFSLRNCSIDKDISLYMKFLKGILQWLHDWLYNFYYFIIVYFWLSLIILPLHFASRRLLLHQKSQIQELKKKKKFDRLNNLIIILIMVAAVSEYRISFALVLQLRARSQFWLVLSLFLILRKARFLHSFYNEMHLFYF